ncbi:tRNA(Ile)-lysidine synthase [Lampropedia hyalina DSM 16112]|jgi:tRNA(Ile)-lysidine synthase|uniref:tRNA(Ile)-lysidine synthase n=1 Tax=Lampropedia hyalina DSM 16112 TaxID=1122156 RepID=A0A1M4X2V6_9BURK|nr:tRNA lysidine(34) synthetase TilS [Lampropedia hyalina]SHE87727.1 tRNA(Ile)-lysidine synthase [Lampropedia hyalina DSM 16112]
MSTLPRALNEALHGLAPHLPLAVAFSGGADSTALLLACWQRWPQQVAAIHVNHGLQEAAAGFEAFARQFCTARGIPLHIEYPHARHASGESPEDAARKARYAALARGVQALNQAQTLPQPIASIALAQHADDQVETLLLALSRGAGLPGLAAMPRQWERNGLLWLRPWLTVPGPQLRHWLQQQGQNWVEDPSNLDLHYTRNRIRHRIVPVLEQAFPAFRQTLARSSAHAQQAQQILEEVAQADLAVVGVPPSIRALQALSAPRQANVLRHWLKQHHGIAAQHRQMQELQRQIMACTTRGHQIHLKIANGHVQRHNAWLHWLTSSPA